MAIDGVDAGVGLEGGGTFGVVPVAVATPVSLLNGGTGVSAFSNGQLLSGIGAFPRAGGHMSGDLTLSGAIVVGASPPPAGGTAGNMGDGSINAKSIFVDGVAVGTGATGLPLTGGTITAPTGGQNPVTIRVNPDGPPNTLTNQLIFDIPTVHQWATGIGAVGRWAIWDATRGGPPEFSIDANGGVVIEAGMLTAGMGPGTLLINDNPSNAIPAAPIGHNALRVVGTDTGTPGTGEGPRIILDSFQGTPASLMFRHGDGTGAAMTPTQNNVPLGILAWRSCGQNLVFSENPTARIICRSTEIHTSTALGGMLGFGVTRNGEAGVTDILTLTADLATITGNLNVAGDINGGAITSDRRLKQNIEPYQRGLEAVCRLQPISYEYNGLGGKIADGITRIGLDADDTSEVMPEIVGQREHGDLDGTPIKTIATQPLTFLLINAVKELAAKIDRLERQTHD